MNSRKFELLKLSSKSRNLYTSKVGNKELYLKEEAKEEEEKKFDDITYISKQTTTGYSGYPKKVSKRNKQIK